MVLNSNQVKINGQPVYQNALESILSSAKNLKYPEDNFKPVLFVNPHNFGLDNTLKQLKDDIIQGQKHFMEQMKEIKVFIV